MRTDYILLKPRKLKASDDVVKAIRKDRKAGVSFRNLAKKYNLSFSYCYYLCLTGENKLEYQQKMQESSKRYYEENRDEVIRKNGEHTKKVREAKRKILKRKVKKGCYIGRNPNLLNQ